MHTFKDTCKILNITEHTLRHYTDNGIIPNPKRDSRNRRIYSDKDLDWLRGAIYLRSLGFSISDISLYHQISSSDNISNISSLKQQLNLFKKQKDEAQYELHQAKIKVNNIDKQIAYITDLIKNKEVDYKSPAHKVYKK